MRRISSRRSDDLPFHLRVVPSRQSLIETRVFPTSLYLASLGQNLAQRPGVNVFSQDIFALNSKYEYNYKSALFNTDYVAAARHINPYR